LLASLQSVSYISHRGFWRKSTKERSGHPAFCQRCESVPSRTESSSDTNL